MRAKRKPYVRFLGGWAAIAALAATAFALATPVQAQQTTAVTTAYLNMRTGPSTSYGVVTAIPAGATVAVYQCTSSRTWCEVGYNGRVGWSSASYLRFQTAQPPQQPPQQPAPPQGGGGTVQATTTVSLNMRTGPSTSYGVVRAVPAGATVAVYRCIPDYSWCEIGYAGSTGWSSARYLRSTGQYGQQPINNVGQQLGLAIFNFILGQIAGGGQQPPQQPPQQPQPRQPAANEICFYSDFDYQGSAFCVRMGQSDAALGADWNDRISSVRTGANAQVEVCRDFNYGQPCRVVGGDIARLPSAWNDQVSSYRTAQIGGGNPPPTTARACFYENWDFQGAFFCFAVGEGTTFLGNWNDRISSVRIEGNASVILCAEANFGGACEFYSQSVSQLTGPRNDTASSLRVQ